MARYERSEGQASESVLTAPDDAELTLRCVHGISSMLGSEAVDAVRVPVRPVDLLRAIRGRAGARRDHNGVERTRHAGCRGHAERRWLIEEVVSAGSAARKKAKKGWEVAEKQTLVGIKLLIPL